MGIQFIEILEKIEKIIRQKKGEVVKKFDRWLFLALLIIMNRVKLWNKR